MSRDPRTRIYLGFRSELKLIRINISLRPAISIRGETEAGRLLQVGDQPSICSEFQASLGKLSNVLSQKVRDVG